MDDMQIVEIGRVRSTVTDPAHAARQGDEGAPDCEIVLADAYASGAAGLQSGQGLVVLTWLHLAARDTLTVHPRGDDARPATGVFGTRSPSRPNPVGLHLVTLLSVEGARLRVRGLEAVDGTPVVDVKPLLGELAAR